MKKILLILILAKSFGCYSQKPVVFSRAEIKIDSILVLPPFSRTYVITKINKQEIDKELSKKTFYTTYNLLQKQFPKPIKATYFVSDSTTQIKLNNFIYTMCEKIDNERLARKYTIPDSILSLFKTANKTMVFCLVNEGFQRGRDNLLRKDLQSKINNAFTSHDYRPLESASLMIGLILDLKERHILFFERNIWQDKDPTDMNVLSLQLNRLLNHCIN